MFDLPMSLARYFLDASGRLDHRALLRTPNAQLVAMARGMHPGERAELFHRLRRLRLNWLQQTMAQAAGIDVEAQRRRFLRVLVEADDPAPLDATPCWGAPAPVCGAVGN